MIWEYPPFLEPPISMGSSEVSDFLGIIAPLPPLSMFSEAARRMVAAASENCDGTPKSSRPRRSRRRQSNEAVESSHVGLAVSCLSNTGHPTKVAKMMTKPRWNCCAFFTHIQDPFHSNVWSFNLSSTLARLAGSSSSTMKSQQRTPDAWPGVQSHETS